MSLALDLESSLALGPTLRPTRRTRERSAARAAPPRAAVASEPTLLAAVSHDLRQPLQAIGLWIEILRCDVTDAHMQEVLAKISETARSLESELESLLDISRLDMRRVETHPTDFPASQLLSRLAATFDPAAQAKGLRLRLRPSRCTIRSDPVLLERIVANLVANAIRYTERGGVLVGGRVRDGKFAIEVWDTGIGIPQARFGDIFDEFVQLARPGIKQEAGAGLGLSIARRIATLLGHTIRVTSRVGRGSCFRVEVPLASSQFAPRLASTGCGALLADVRGAFVVVIDDESAVREAVGDILGHWGCHAVVAQSAHDAIAQLATHLRAPDILISDYRLEGGQTGLQAIAAVRDVLGVSVPAAIITGERHLIINAAPAADGIAVLRKPIESSALHSLIAEYCKPSEAAG